MYSAHTYDQATEMTESKRKLLFHTIQYVRKKDYFEFWIELHKKKGM